jgi:hypothetical protein
LDPDAEAGVEEGSSPKMSKGRRPTWATSPTKAVHARPATTSLESAVNSTENNVKGASAAHAIAAADA